MWIRWLKINVMLCVILPLGLALPAQAQEDIFAPPIFGPKLPLGLPGLTEKYTDSDGRQIDVKVPTARLTATVQEFYNEEQRLSKAWSEITEKLEASLPRLSGLDQAQRANEKIARRAVEDWKALADLLSRVSGVEQRLDPFHPNRTEILNELRRLREAEASARKLVTKRKGTYDESLRKWNTARSAPYSQSLARLAVERDFLHNIVLNAWHHQPGSVVEVRLESRLGPVYRTQFVQDDNAKKLIDAIVVAQTGLESFNKALDDFDREREERWQEFIGLRDKFHRLNDEQTTEANQQLAMDAVLEIVDVAISTASSENPGRALVWEAMWRGGGVAATLIAEGQVGFERKLETARVPKDLIDAQIALAEADPSRRNTPLPRPDTPFSAAQQAQWIYNINLGRSRSNLDGDAREYAVQQIFEAGMNSATRDQTIQMIRDRGLLNTTLGLAARRGQSLKDLPPPITGAESLREIRKNFRISKLGAELITSEVTSRLKNKALSSFDLERHRLEYEKAVTSIDYYIVRNELRAGLIDRTDIFSVMHTMLKVFADELSKLPGPCCKRTPKYVDLSGTVSALEDEYDETDKLTLVVITDKEMPTLRYQLASGAQAAFDRSEWIGPLQFEHRAKVPITAFEEGDDGGTIGLSIEGGSVDGWQRERLDGDPRSFAVPSSFTVSTPITNYTGFEETADTLHKLPVISPQSGIYFAAIDMFGAKGLRILPAPDLPITVYDADGEIAAEDVTPPHAGPVFLQLPPGKYRVTLAIPGYFPVPEVSCGTLYERNFELEKKQKLSFGAKVRLVDVADNGSTLGSFPGDCIVPMK